MYHPMFCFLTDATLPPFPSDFRLPLCDRLLAAVSSVCSQRSHRRLTKPARSPKPGLHSFLCMPGPGPCFSSVACPTLKCSLQGVFCWLPGFFVWLSEEHRLPLPHLSVFSFSFPTRQISAGFPPSWPTRTTWYLFFVGLCTICWRWSLCIFLTFSHSINSLYPTWIIGRLTAIWKSRWCFPDLPPPSLSWLKGN